MPRVSVIVTTYNRKEFLTETIQSILNQTYQDFELIVVDNFSNYDFFDLINNFKSEKIIPFQNQNNGIIAVNHNFGIKNAKGEFLAFCDDDDSWMPKKLEEQVKILENNNSDLVYANAFTNYESGKTEITNYSATNTFNQLVFTNHITLSSVVLRNNYQIQFNENRFFAGIEDYELWLKLSMDGFKFNFIQTPLVKYRVLNASFSRLSRSKNETKIIELKYTLLNNKLNFNSKLFLYSSLMKSYIRYSILKLLKR